MLFSRQILNGSQDFFLFIILILILTYFFLNNETIEMHARAFLTLIILAIGTVLNPITEAILNLLLEF